MAGDPAPGRLGRDAGPLAGQPDLQGATADLAHDREIQQYGFAVDAGGQLGRRAAQRDPGARPGNDSFTGWPRTAVPPQFAPQPREQVRRRRTGRTLEHDATELSGIEREAVPEVAQGRDVVRVVGYEDHLRGLDRALRSVHDGIDPLLPAEVTGRDLGKGARLRLPVAGCQQ